MKLLELLEMLETMDNSSPSIYPDGSHPTDTAFISIGTKGHGKLKDAEVTGISVGACAVLIFAELPEKGCWDKEPEKQKET